MTTIECRVMPCICDCVYLVTSLRSTLLALQVHPREDRHIPLDLARLGHLEKAIRFLLEVTPIHTPYGPLVKVSSGPRFPKGLSSS